MTRWWTDREPREKVLIGIALALAGILIGWKSVLKPVLSFPKDQKFVYEKFLYDLQAMREAQQLIAATRPNTRAQLDASQLQSVVTKMAEAGGLSISRRQPGSDGALTLWLEDIDSRQFYGWITSLTGEYDVALTHVTLSRNGDGTIQVQLSFQPGT